VTKVVTATAVLQLMEKGKLALTDPVSKYLPEFAEMKFSEDALDLEAGERVMIGEGLADFEKARPGYGYGLGVRTHISTERSGQKSPLGEFGWSGVGGAFSMIDTKNRLSLTYFQQMQSWSMAIQNNMRNALYEALEGELSQ
jgi:CubicO group peptidase (beta-lactamase class C family)